MEPKKGFDWDLIRSARGFNGSEIQRTVAEYDFRLANYRRQIDSMYALGHLSLPEYASCLRRWKNRSENRQSWEVR